MVIRNNVAVNINVYVFVWTCVFISVGYISRIKIAGLYGNSVYGNSFEKLSYCFPKWLQNFTFLPEFKNI